MKVLWIVNSLLPDIARVCGLKSDNDGGWLTGMLHGLNSFCNEPEIIICFPFSGKRLQGQVNNLKFISFAEKSNYKENKKTKQEIADILENEDPEIIHIFGTEFPHALAAVKWAEENGKLDRVLINIQGLISKCSECYYAGLPFSVVHRFTLRDFIKRGNIYRQRKKFAKRGKLEIAVLKTAKHVSGRTDWDKVCVLDINDKIHYHKCNETLRDVFYSGQWEKNNIEPYSVFVTQCGYPLKAFHMVLKAFRELVKKYPDAHLYTTGKDLTSLNVIKNTKHRTYYDVYLKKLIYKYNLKEHVTFLGSLNGEEIKERLLKSHVFVLPSSLENSSNSLGEALLLGVPCVASDVGGVRTFIKHGENGLIYSFDETQTLANYIDEIFSDDSLAENLSVNARQSVKTIFDVGINAKTLFAIYREIAGSSGENDNEK